MYPARVLTCVNILAGFFRLGLGCFLIKTLIPSQKNKILWVCSHYNLKKNTKKPPHVL